MPGPIVNPWTERKNATNGRPEDWIGDDFLNAIGYVNPSSANPTPERNPAAGRAPALIAPRVVEDPAVMAARQAKAAAKGLDANKPETGIRQHASGQTDSNYKTIENKNTWADEDKIQQLMAIFEGGDATADTQIGVDEKGNPIMQRQPKTYEGLPGFVAQREGQQRMEDLLAMQASQPVANTSWQKPLAAMADYFNQKRGLRTDNVGAVQEEPTQEQKFSKMMTGMQTLQKDRGDYNARLMDAARSFKSGSIQDQLNQQILAKFGADTGMPNKSSSYTPAQRQQLQDNMIYDRLTRTVKGDKALATRLQQIQNLQNGLKLLTDAKITTPQQFHDAQQTIIGNLGIKGLRTGAERAAQLYDPLGMKLENAEQILFGEPKDVKNFKAFMDHIRDLSTIEQGNAAEQYRNSLDSASEGHADLLERNPQLKSSFEKLLKAKRSQISVSPSAAPAKSPLDVLAEQFLKEKAAKNGGK